jgi:hypothetical protein
MMPVVRYHRYRHALIHLSALKRNYANFVLTEFYEVRIAPAQRLWASLAAIGCLRILSDLPWLPHKVPIAGGLGCQATLRPVLERAPV